MSSLLERRLRQELPELASALVQAERSALPDTTSILKPTAEAGFGPTITALPARHARRRGSSGSVIIAVAAGILILSIGAGVLLLQSAQGEDATQTDAVSNGESSPPPDRSNSEEGIAPVEADGDRPASSTGPSSPPTSTTRSSSPAPTSSPTPTSPPSASIPTSGTSPTSSDRSTIAGSSGSGPPTTGLVTTPSTTRYITPTTPGGSATYPATPPTSTATPTYPASTTPTTADTTAIGPVNPPDHLSAGRSGQLVALSWDVPSSGPEPLEYVVYRFGVEIGRVSQREPSTVPVDYRYQDLLAPPDVEILYEVRSVDPRTDQVSATSAAQTIRYIAPWLVVDAEQTPGPGRVRLNIFGNRCISASAELRRADGTVISPMQDVTWTLYADNGDAPCATRTDPDYADLEPGDYEVRVVTTIHWPTEAGWIERETITRTVAATVEGP